jgi:hypothetical protein
MLVHATAVQAALMPESQLGNAWVGWPVHRNDTLDLYAQPAEILHGAGLAGKRHRQTISETNRVRARCHASVATPWTKRSARPIHRRSCSWEGQPVARTGKRGLHGPRQPGLPARATLQHFE